MNQILDVATIEAGGLTLRPESLDTEIFFDNIVSLFSSQIAEKRLDLVISYIGNVPQKIAIDPVNFRKVLINLISNAIKFTRSGGIYVFISWREGVLAGEVGDTGMGIPKQFQSKIFETFQQADNSYARQYGGTGLGLPISRQICRFMDGEMFLHSSDDAGSVFKFFVQAPASSELFIPALFKSGNANKSSNANSGHKILVCSDSTMMQSWFANELGAIDISKHVSSLCDIEKAIVEICDYSLVILDTVITEEERKQLALASDPTKQCILWLSWLGQALPAGLPNNIRVVTKPLHRSGLVSVCGCANDLRLA